MDNEDYEDENQLQVKTLTHASSVVITTTDYSHYLGVILTPTGPGLAFYQSHEEITPSTLDGLVDLSDLELSTPVETFLPWTSVRSIQSLEDLSLETLLTTFRDDLDSYGESDPDPDTKEIKDPSGTVWFNFLAIIDRVLKKAGI